MTILLVGLSISTNRYSILQTRNKNKNRNFKIQILLTHTDTQWNDRHHHWKEGWDLMTLWAKGCWSAITCTTNQKSISFSTYLYLWLHNNQLEILICSDNRSIKKCCGAVLLFSPTPTFATIFLCDIRPNVDISPLFLCFGLLFS